ncbi:DUF1064 domain-containing protein [Neobacillus sp. NPDC058068]|uniref:DUF1064 domain-containing protein n=1 Tax=Neobacillus sp. NPDC058068 TaxID=3346325 RepID=UPI0036DDAB95
MAANKYGNKQVIVDGHKFDSIAESKYYGQLQWLKQAKQIKDFKLQPRFLLLESYKKNGKTVRKTEYVADFEIHNLDGSVEIIDVKGVETPVFRLKKKMFEARYEHTLKVVTLDETHGWVELDKLKKLKKKPKKKVKPSAKKKAAAVGYPLPKRTRKVSNGV